VEGGNGNGLIDANECDNLYVTLANPTAAPVTVRRRREA
jgi:dUTPase